MDKLKELRIKDRFSYKAIADMLHISKTYYWQLEHGQRRLSYDMAVKIAAIFHMRPDELFLEETLKRQEESFEES